MTAFISSVYFVSIIYYKVVFHLVLLSERKFQVDAWYLSTICWHRKRHVPELKIASELSVNKKGTAGIKR